MAEKVYVLIQFRAREAMWQLSDEEMNSLVEKIGKAREEAGGKELARFSAYSSEWRGIRVYTFPDMEAFHKYHMAVHVSREGLNVQKYIDLDITLGFEPPT